MKKIIIYIVVFMVIISFFFGGLQGFRDRFFPTEVDYLLPEAE